MLCQPKPPHAGSSKQSTCKTTASSNSGPTNKKTTKLEHKSASSVNGKKSTISTTLAKRSLASSSTSFQPKASLHSKSYSPMHNTLLNPSDSVRLYLGLALSLDDDDPVRKSCWRWVYRQANRVVNHYHSIGRDLIEANDVIEYWQFAVEDANQSSIELDDLQCGFKTLAQELRDHGFECVSYQDFERHSDLAWSEQDVPTDQERINRKRELEISQHPVEQMGRPEYPFLNGMYERTLPEPSWLQGFTLWRGSTVCC